MLKRNFRSGIINLSSFAILFEFVQSAGYCSTKLFDDFLSKTLADEYSHKIDILSSTPNGVTTPLTRNNKSVGVITKNQTAKGTLRDLGHVKGTYGHWNHHIQGTIVECMSGSYVLVMMIKFIWSKIKIRNLQIDSKYSVIRWYNHYEIANHNIQKSQQSHHRSIDAPTLQP